MRQINRAWRDGRVEDLAPMVHPKVAMVSPDITGKTLRPQGGYRELQIQPESHQEVIFGV